MRTDISVIIVNWNTKDLLCQCIRSVKSKTNHVSLEIIVVDNASTDGSQQAVRDEFPEVKLIQNSDNLGFAKANNIGMKSSLGKYLCLVNSDVEVKDGCIDKIHEYMENHTEVGMAGPKVCSPDGSLQISFKRFPKLWISFCEACFLDRIFPNIKLFASAESVFINTNEISKVDMLAGVFWFIRHSSLIEVGLLDGNFFFYGEDVDWCKRFDEKGWEVVFYPHAEIIHYGGMSTAASPVKYYIQLYRAKLQYRQKHGSKKSLVILKLIFMLRQMIRIILNAILYLLSCMRKQQFLYKLKCNISCFLWLVKTPLAKII